MALHAVVDELDAGLPAMPLAMIVAEGSSTENRRPVMKAVLVLRFVEYRHQLVFFARGFGGFFAFGVQSPDPTYPHFGHCLST